MIFTKSSRKPIEKVSSDSDSLSFDLYSNLTYMAALSVGVPSRDVMLAKAITQNFVTGVFFRQVYLLSKRAGFEYARAFRLVSRKAHAESIKNLLLRFAGAINSGVEESEFLLEEAHVESEQYNSSYLRSLETLSKWADAYAALMVSVTLVVVVAMVSVMLSPLGNAFLMVLTVSQFFVTAFGVYIVFRVAPTEETTYQSGRGPKHRRIAKRLFLICGPIGLFGGLFLSYSFGIGALMLVFGLGLMPAGIYGFIDHQRVSKIDKEVASFVRAMGNITASLGSSFAAAMGKLDRRSLRNLEPLIRRLQIRLDRGLDANKSWEAFRDEAGSELLNRSTRMFVDGVNLGGAPDKVGSIAAKYAMDTSLLRERRTVSAAPFAFLTFPLHFAMTALMVFILEILFTFNDQITLALLDVTEQGANSGLTSLPALPVFQEQNLAPLAALTLAALIAMTVANSLAPKFAIGGHAVFSTLFASICFILTGLNMLIIPKIASGILLSGTS